MKDIPTGKVTFLFTDIEGSTKLSQQFPDMLPAALEIHHSILTRAIESYNGFIFQIVGDAFHCAFENPEDAVKAAVEIQTNLENEKWDEAVIRTRIGIHSGRAEWNGKNYMGYITLARTARVMSAAYGGQILVSNDAYEFCKDHSDTVNEIDFSFRDLGERRLKDVIQPIRLFQIVVKGLREDFPPLITLDARPNNLPTQLTNFIGREKEMKHARELLKDNRLLTIAGTGGAGKTRFSLQIGADSIDEFDDGVWLIELAALSDPFLLPQAFLDSLGIKEQPGKTPEQTLTDYLKDKEILTILDNCEHLIDACAVMTESLLLKCPKLKIIATSREALNCSGEQIYRIPPLTQPEPNSACTPERLSQYESVRLFIERALAVNPTFRITNENAPVLAEVCSRLDGIPLAIELAAARIRVLTVDKIHERLDDRFRLLTGGRRTALPRQQTLRALLDWSYDLLSEEERILWNRLSVFSGGWTLEAAEDICTDKTISKNEILDLLSQLTEKSVIIYDETRNRYRILESIRHYGIEKLSDGNEIFLRHLNYFSELSEKALPELSGENTKLWMDKIDADHNNFISAIEWSVKNNNPEKGAVTASALGRFWSTKGHYSTGIRLNENILQSSGALSDSLKSSILNWIGILKYSQGDYEQAKKYSEESLAISKINGDKKGISDSLNCLGRISVNQGDYEKGKKYSEESLAIKIEISDKKGVADSINNLGAVAYYHGDFEQAKKYFAENLDIRKELGDKKGMALSLNNMGGILYTQGDYEQAKKYYEASLTIKKEIGGKNGIADSLNNLGSLSTFQGDYEQAKKYYEESLAIRKEIGDKKGIADSLNNLGSLLSYQGEYEQAKKYSEESLTIRKEIGDKKGVADCLINLGGLSIFQGEYVQAKKYSEESLAICNEIGDKIGVAESMNNLGSVSVSRGDRDQAKKFYEESLAIGMEIEYKPGIANTLIYLARLFELNEKHFTAVKLLYAAIQTIESLGIVFNFNAEKQKNELAVRLNKLLSEAEFSKYHEEGKKLTLEEACKLALSNYQF